MVSVAQLAHEQTLIFHLEIISDLKQKDGKIFDIIKTLMLC